MGFSLAYRLITFIIGQFVELFLSLFLLQFSSF